MNTHVSVLINGAGPTGLTMATVLQRYGISFQLIDKKPQSTQTSNALGLHARTLELMEDLDVVSPFLNSGKKIFGAHINVNTTTLAKLDLTQINSMYPFVLILPQSRTEEILEQHLNAQGIFIQRECELIKIDSIEHRYTLRLNDRGTEKLITADYVIACDGSHSLIREACKIPFVGEDLPQPFALADVKATTSLSLDKIHAFYNTQGMRKGLLAAFPLPNGNMRLIADLNAIGEIKQSEIDIKQIAQHRSRGEISVDTIAWSSHFWIHSKLITKMRHGNIFFAGDAAHVHSPVGGQGMNTGMQDAYNLGWKLSLVLLKKARPTILNSYHTERYPIIQALVKETEKLTRLMLTRNPAVQFLRNLIARPLFKLKPFNFKVANRLSMLGISYKQSSIVNYDSVISSHSPHPGSLTPEVKLTSPHHFKEFLHSTHFIALIFTGKNPSSKTINQIQSLVEWLEFSYKALIQPLVITPTAIKTTTDQLDDKNNLIAKTFSVEGTAICLLRPDKYIALSCTGLNKQKLKRYLNKIAA